MNKEEELKQKAYREISNYVGGFWVEYHFNETELEEYAQQVRQELFKKIESQKFFHALPPTAKDEYYDFVNQTQKQ